MKHYTSEGTGASHSLGELFCEKHDVWYPSVRFCERCENELNEREHLFGAKVRDAIRLAKHWRDNHDNQVRTKRKVSGAYDDLIAACQDELGRVPNHRRPSEQQID